MATTPADCKINGSNLLTCDFGTILSGGHRSFTVSKTTVAGDCPSIHNDVTVAASNEPEGKTGDDSDGADIVVLNCPDIQVIKYGNGPVSAGQSATFSIVVKNLGPGTGDRRDPRRPAPLRDLDAGRSPMPVTAQIDAPSNELTCDFGDSRSSTPPGRSRSRVARSRRTAAEIPNDVTVAATNEGADVLDNNSPTTATIEVDCPLIVITKTADDEEVSAGDQIGFVVEVTNTGAGSAFGDHGRRRPASRAGLDDRRRELVGRLVHRPTAR